VAVAELGFVSYTSHTGGSPAVRSGARNARCGASPVEPDVSRSGARPDRAAAITHWDCYRLLANGDGRVLERLVRESGQNPELVDVVRSILYARRRLYATLLNRAIARGELPPEMDQELLLDLLLGPLWFRLLLSGVRITPSGRTPGPDLRDRRVWRCPRGRAFRRCGRVRHGSALPGRRKAVAKC
jgi:hypothetical protein